MECNKDEAMRAKDIAARKFTENNYSGAKKFALKAQTLYPGLDGISQMLSTLDVYIAADNRVSGERDLYGILGVTPLADDDTIKKQYRKLVLQLHPDKNKSIGADGAFLFVTEAFNVLSDKSQRFAYNSKRHTKMAQKIPQPFTVPVVPPSQTSSVPVPPPSQTSSVPVPPLSQPSSVPAGGVNGHRKPARSTASRGKSQTGRTQNQYQKDQSFFAESDSFWTMCSKCKMQYEYIQIYLDQLVKCPNCKQGFQAVEIPPPSNLAPVRPGNQHLESSFNSEPHVSGVNISFNGASTRWRPIYGTTACNNLFSTSAAHSRAPTKSQLAKKNVKRARVVDHALDTFWS